MAASQTAVMVPVPGLPIPLPLPGGGGLLPHIPFPKNPLTQPITDMGGLISNFTNPNTWVRVAEFAAGILLVALGVNAMLHNPAGAAIKTAGKLK